MAHDVFLSYAAKDKTVADAVCAALEAKRIRCWIAPRDILPGMDFGEAIVNAIYQCRLVVIIFSAQANGSDHVKNEVERAVNEAKPIIPFRVENVLPSGCLALHLSRRHWLDALTPPLEKHLKKLTKTAQLILSVKREKPGEEVVGSIFSQTGKPSQSFFRRKATILGSAFIVICVIAAALFIGRTKKEATPPVAVANESLEARPAADLEEHLRIAADLVEKGRIEEAIKEYEKASSLGLTDPRPYQHLAALFENQNNLEKSLYYYRKFVASAPEDTDLVLFHEKIEFLENQLASAGRPQRDAQPADENVPRKDTPAPSVSAIQREAETSKLLNLGIEGFRNEDYSQCIERMESVLKLDPGNSSAKYFLEQAKKEKEREQTEKGVKDCLSKADAAYQEGDYRACLEHAKKALELDPNNASAKKLSDSAGFKIAPEQINSVVNQYGQCLNNDNLLSFYKDYCSPSLYQRMTKEAEQISREYSRLNSVVSDVHIRFTEIYQAEVSFSNIITGTSVRDGKKRVLYEGTVKWDMDKHEDSWQIKSINVQPRETKGAGITK